MTYGLDTIVGCLWRKIMNHLTFLLMLADSLHVWAAIPVFNSFSLKMSLMHFVHVTIGTMFVKVFQNWISYKKVRECICDPTQENRPNWPKGFLSVGSFKDKKGNNSKLPALIFLKFRNFVRECKCQLFMWSINFSCAEKIIKLSSEDGENFINKNWCVQKIS